MVSGHGALANEPTAPVSPAVGVGADKAAPPPATNQSRAEAVTNSPVAFPTVTVMGELNESRDKIAPSLGAVTYTMGPEQIQSVPGGESAPFSQVLLRAPGVVADSYGEDHVRGEHGDLTYRVNGVLLPEGLNGFGQELDTRLINSMTLIDGSLPAQCGFRTAGIVDVTTKSSQQLNAAIYRWDVVFRDREAFISIWQERRFQRNRLFAASWWQLP
jgi:hypothetical protein